MSGLLKFLQMFANSVFTVDHAHKDNLKHWVKFGNIRYITTAADMKKKRVLQGNPLHQTHSCTVIRRNRKIFQAPDKKKALVQLRREKRLNNHLIRARFADNLMMDAQC